MQVSARGAASSGDLSNRSSGEQALDSFSEPAREEEHATGAPSCDGRTNLNGQVGSPAVISVDAVDTAEMPHQEQVRSQADQLSNVRFADRMKNVSVRAVARAERGLPFSTRTAYEPVSGGKVVARRCVSLHGSEG